MKIKQSYHGNGGKEGYLFQLFNGETKLFEIEDVPSEVNYGSTLNIGGNLFYVDNIYDCEESAQELEVIWYELKPLEVDFTLKLI